MKSKLKLCVVLFILIALLTFMFNTNVFATDLENDENNVVTTSEETNSITEENIVSSGDNANTSEDEMADIYSGDLYVLFNENNDYNSSTYVMDKNVDGNVFIFGQDVKITGRINGSLFVFASTVTIEESAYVGCHVFAFADRITMSGFTYDMYAAATEFQLTQSGVAYRDLKVSADTAYLYGSVGRDINIAGNNIDVYADSDNCLYVAGNINYTSTKVIEDLDKITVNGEINYTEAVEDTTNENEVANYIYDGLENTVFTLVAYLLLIFLAPKFIEKSREYVSTKTLLAAAIGVAFTILLPVAAFILLFTTLGISISFTALMIYFIILMINSAVVTITVNEFIASKIPAINATWKKILMIIPVSLVIFILRQIPYHVGTIITVIILFVGVGITVLYQFDKRKNDKVSKAQ